MSEAISDDILRECVEWYDHFDGNKTESMQAAINRYRELCPTQKCGPITAEMLTTSLAQVGWHVDAMTIAEKKIVAAELNRLAKLQPAEVKRRHPVSCADIKRMSQRFGFGWTVYRCDAVADWIERNIAVQPAEAKRVEVPAEIVDELCSTFGLGWNPNRRHAVSEWLTQRLNPPPEPEPGQRLFESLKEAGSWAMLESWSELDSDRQAKYAKAEQIHDVKVMAAVEAAKIKGECDAADL